MTAKLEVKLEVANTLLTGDVATHFQRGTELTSLSETVRAYNLRMSLFTFCSVRFLFQLCVYYKYKIFKILSNIYTSVSEDESSSEYSSDSDNVNIPAKKPQ